MTSCPFRQSGLDNTDAIQTRSQQRGVAVFQRFLGSGIPISPKLRLLGKKKKKKNQQFGPVRSNRFPTAPGRPASFRMR